VFLTSTECLEWRDVIGQILRLSVHHGTILNVPTDQTK